MAGVNETPRQKMMGILYLVLLGLAATTITQQVLDAFRNLTVGLETSTSNVQSTIDKTFAAFEAGTLKDDPGRARPYWDKAQKVKASVEDLDNYIKSIKKEFEDECGGFDPDLGDYKQRENVDISPRVMMHKGRAEELRKKIEATKQVILSQLDERERANFKMALNADDPVRKKGDVKKTWAESFFGDGTPLTAAFTALTKIQADLRATESEAVKKILASSSKTDLVLDQYSAIAVPTSSSYVLVGQPYTAEVFLTAFSNSLNPDITVGGQTLKVTDGKGLYTVSTGKEGEFKWSATLRMKKADGTVGEWKTPEMTYRVARPSAVASAEKMKVLYIGVPNPMSVSAPGTPLEKISVQMSGGEARATATKGTYDVFVKQRGTVTVSIFGQDDKGKPTKLGESQFRCKPLPNPIPMFGGKGFGPLPKAQVTSSDRIFATNPPDFEFDAKFDVTHFLLYSKRPRVDAKKFESSNKMLTPEMKAELSSAPAGTQLIFDEINVMGPDGVKRTLAPIVFNIQ